jgi:hypothetical protein
MWVTTISGALQLVVILSCKRKMNPVTNSSPVYNHSITWEYELTLKGRKVEGYTVKRPSNLIQWENVKRLWKLKKKYSQVFNRVNTGYTSLKKFIVNQYDCFPIKDHNYNSSISTDLQIHILYSLQEHVWNLNQLYLHRLSLGNSFQRCNFLSFRVHVLSARRLSHN